MGRVGLTLLLEALRWAAGTWLLWRVPLVPPAPPVELVPDGDACIETVSVVVPARNEATVLPALLASLAQQSRPADEVVVVDDQSDDGTAEVAMAHGATVVDAPPPPEGWLGKPWACSLGAEAAGGDVLVFLDADTRLEPHALASVLELQRVHGGLVSVQPHHVTVRPYEALSAVFNVVALMAVGICSPLGDRRPPAGAFGPCLATSRDDYVAAGEHGAVRGEVLEDVALARAYRAAGLRVACRGGRGIIEFRMYPGGLGQLAEGWTKNFASGARATRPVTLLLVVVWLSGLLTAGSRLGADPSLVAAAVYAAYALQLAWMLARVGRFPAWAWLAFPVPTAAFVVVFARSLVATVVLRRVRWKGRTVPASWR